MRVFGLLLSATVLAAIASPALAGSPEAMAPPMLSPIVARDVADACPGTRGYADALVRGITNREAVAAEPVFAACAAPLRFSGFRWKTDAATVALAAVRLSRGLLNHDAELLRRAASGSSELRARTGATDAQIRAWPVIPDYFAWANSELVAYDYLPLIANNANREREPFVNSPIVQDAAYINVAARTGEAWILTPRTVTRKLYVSLPAVGIERQPPTPQNVRAEQLRPENQGGQIVVDPAIREPH